MWCFHHWEQLDRQLAHIIQATGPHFVLYTTSKNTWQSLAEEINPFTVAEALDIPRFSAIVCMTANANRVTPFLMKASPPLPVQENRSSVRLECRYGRPISQVSDYIEEKEQIFYV